MYFQVPKVKLFMLENKIIVSLSNQVTLIKMSDLLRGPFT